MSPHTPLSGGRFGENWCEDAGAAIASVIFLPEPPVCSFISMSKSKKRYSKVQFLFDVQDDQRSPVVVKWYAERRRQRP